MGVVRHIATYAGGVATAHGLATENEVTLIIAGAVTLAGVVFSYFNKRKLVP